MSAVKAKFGVEIVTKNSKPVKMMKRSGNLPHFRLKIDTAKIYSLEADPEIFAGEGYAQDIF